jgi:hypothetical protein
MSHHDRVRPERMLRREFEPGLDDRLLSTSTDLDGLGGVFDHAS